VTYYTASEVRQRVGGLTASAAESELSRISKSATGTFDIFLSHSVRDADLILGLKRMLEAEGCTVYVDWIDDADLDRQNVKAATAARLRERMRLVERLFTLPLRMRLPRDGCHGSSASSTERTARRRSRSVPSQLARGDSLAKSI
jgi:hypothetical protein